MSTYDYRSGKQRIHDILNNKLEVFEEAIPAETEFTFENGYYGWVTAVFVDIRDSSTLFSGDDRVKISKIIKSFTSEVIEILRDDGNLREIGIRGDCVYAIYSTPQKKDIYEIYNKSCYVNTFMYMLNTLLVKKSYPHIKVGIGMACAKELVVKAGRKNVGINSIVWIGEAVTKASHLSSIGNKDSNGALVYSEVAYNNFIDYDRNINPKSSEWFTRHFSFDLGFYYTASITCSNFEKWIVDGMND